jgi:hypothetical protein
LGRWGRPLVEGPSDELAFRSHWLVFPLDAHLSDYSPDRPPATIEIRTADQPMLVEIAAGTVRVRPGTASSPDAVLTGKPSLVLGLLTGALDLDVARARGLVFDGDVETLRRVQPLAARTGGNRAPRKRAARSPRSAKGSKSRAGHR